MPWKSQGPHLWKWQSYPLEDAECSNRYIPMDEGDLRCTGVHSQQEYCSQRSQARQHSGRLTKLNKGQLHRVVKSTAREPDCHISEIWLACGVWYLARRLPRAFSEFFIVNMGDLRGDCAGNCLTEENSVSLAFYMFQLPQNATIELGRLFLLSLSLKQFEMPTSSSQLKNLIRQLHICLCWIRDNWNKHMGLYHVDS